MSKSQEYPDHTNLSDRKVKNLQKNNNSQQACNIKQVVFAYNTKIFLLMHHDDFFLSVYQKAFKYYGFKILPDLPKDIKIEAVIIIDDFTNNCHDFITQVKLIIQGYPFFEDISIILPGDSPPSEIAERIIYSLSQNQR